MNLRRTVATGLAVLLSATTLVACSSDSSSSSSGDVTIRIGTTDSTKKAWSAMEDAAKENGINLEITNFSDYSTPNLALSQDQIDVNQFQHLKFLAEYNTGNNDDLTPVGATEIVPLALFWKDHSDLNGIEGKSVAIPNDPSNQGRAINVLVQAGLITLKEEAKGLVTPAPADIDEGASKVSVTPVDAAQTTAAYGEGTPAIINNSFLDRAGIDPNLAVFQDNPDSTEAEPYINVFVTKQDKKDDPNIAKLVELWHTQPVQDAIAEDSKGTSVEVQRTPEELQSILDRLEQQAQ
ncbi:MetQ/NlpA family ABC transporter substrate-binding protein [Corynebacterium vitaeruminis]|uniref:D-methionine-binding lipoprotein n=1 Tax=Corynebacterium vitaeruminis DSM 20294 TaxID=1224164 RepID=W5XZ28_9CORY|nr:MetQ/NlpA family ABC transporter substrate-binding protein [Corynebacterium vitaeruminis]AHI21944.1 D-methionine-binding lipoprotein [Corynebacterium vitaeruminis DSM 20294]